MTSLPRLSEQKTVVTYDVNGVPIEQKQTDGFINGTAMCVAHGKNIADWFRNQDTIELLTALASDLGIKSKHEISHDSSVTKVSAAYPALVISKRGSTENGGGTWVHPDLAIMLAQWCSPKFAIQVSRWVQTWMTTGRNPTTDIDRVGLRGKLKGEARIRLTDQIKAYLESIQQYADGAGGKLFSDVHNAINIAITGETADEMRSRLDKYLGRKTKKDELLRDYFPIVTLQMYISMCEVSANLMLKEGMHPLDAVSRAASMALPASHKAESIDFVEHIKQVERQIETEKQKPMLNSSNDQANLFEMFANR